MKCHHLGIACQSIPETLQHIRAVYGVATMSEILYDDQQKASLCLVHTTTGIDLELIAGEPVKRFVETGTILYHTCYTVSDIEAEINRFKQHDAILVSPPKPAILFGNRRVAFLHTPVGLVELLEAEPGLSDWEEIAL